MEVHNMKVLLLDKEDYRGILFSLQGLDGQLQKVYDSDLVIDKTTGKILKSRHFPLKP